MSKIQFDNPFGFDEENMQTYGESLIFGKGLAPMWLKELQRLAMENKPLFVGRLENDWWKEDNFLVVAIENSLIEIIPKKGFVITEKGKQIVSENRLDMTPRPPDYYD